MLPIASSRQSAHVEIVWSISICPSFCNKNVVKIVSHKS